MFTIELKDQQQWCKYNFHVSPWPIDPLDFPFEVRSERRVRRAKTKLLIFTKELANMIKSNPENIRHISHLMERGHLVAMNEDAEKEEFENLLNGTAYE